MILPIIGLKHVARMRSPRLAAPGAIVAFAFGLSSCAVGPDFKKPDGPDAKGYEVTALPEVLAGAPVPGGEEQKIDPSRDIPFDWWKQFGSPKLDALVDKAFRNNPSVAAAQASLKQAQEMVYAQDGFFFPTLGADYNFTRNKVSGNTANSSAPGVQGNGSDITPAVQNTASSPHNEPLFYNFHTAQLTISFVPDVFGANRRKVESLEAQTENQRFQMEATCVSLASNVVAAVVQEAALRAQITATQKFIDANARSLDILHKQFDVGYVMRLDVATQEAALAQAMEMLPPLQKQLAQTQDLIRALVGALPGDELDTSFEFADLHLPQQLPLTLPSKLVEQRPDVRASEALWHSASANVGVAIAAEIPQFDITGSYGVISTQLRQLIYPGSGFWNFTGDLSQTIFDGGTLLHTRRAADQALLQAAAQYRSTVIGAMQNVADTLHAIQSDADTLAAAAAAEQAAKVMLDVTQRQYDVGAVNFLSLLAAQENYQQAAVTLIQAQGNRFGDTAALFQALGGGWWNRTDGDQPPVGSAVAQAAVQAGRGDAGTP